MFIEVDVEDSISAEVRKAVFNVDDIAIIETSDGNCTIIYHTIAYKCVSEYKKIIATMRSRSEHPIFRIDK